MVGLELPIVPVEHHYLVTEPIPEVRALRDETYRCFATPTSRFMSARRAVRPTGRSVRGRDGDLGESRVCPRTFTAACCRRIMERLETCLQGCARRLPMFEDAGIQTIVNGPDGYTPDGHCLDGTGSWTGELPHAGGIQHFRHRVRRREWQVRCRVDRPRSAERQHVGARCPAVRRLQPHRSTTSAPGPWRSTAASMRSATPGRSSRPDARSRRVRSTTSWRAKRAVYGARFGWERPLVVREERRRPGTNTRFAGATGTKRSETECQRGEIVRWGAGPGELCEVRGLRAGGTNDSLTIYAPTSCPRPPGRIVAHPDVHSQGRNRV